MFEPQSDHERLLQYRCRRGLKELDVMIQPFLEDHYRSLTEPQKADFYTLMHQEDPDLLDWFLRYKKPADPAVEAIVEVFLQRLGR